MIFEKKKKLSKNEMCVCFFFLEIFFILRKTERDVMRNVFLVLM